MKSKEFKLASVLLKIAEDEFSRHGCNNLSQGVWKDWTTQERQEFIKDFHDWNGGYYNIQDDPENLDLPDWVVMAFLASKLKEQAENE